jgi:hypothetical protein
LQPFLKDFYVPHSNVANRSVCVRITCIT